MFSILKKFFQRPSRKAARPEAPPEAPPEPAVAGRDAAYRHSHAEPDRPETADLEPAPTVPKAPEKPPAGATRPKRPAGRPKPRAGKKRRKAPKAPAKNRHGIPVFQRDADIESLFDNRPASAGGEEESQGHEAARRPAPPRVRRTPRNKHGIPVFGEQTDFSMYFRDGAQGADAGGGEGRRGTGARQPEVDDFSALLEASLADKGMEALLQEKLRGAEGDLHQSREQVIRGYPPPQEELDLHGRTSREAVAQTRAFVERARYRGKRTVLIIVGKGLHSEGRAVLPDVVAAELARLRQEKQVLAHRWERGAKRKSGAIIVYLHPIRAGS